MFRQKITNLFIFCCLLLLGTQSINAQQNKFPAGTYRITMLLNVDDRQVDLRQLPIDFEIEVNDNSITVRRTEKLYTPDFSDDENFDLTMKAVDTKNIEVTYKIKDYITEQRADGSSVTYCVCTNEDGEECRAINGVIGEVSNGTDLRAFRFSDFIFNNIFWCYEDGTFKNLSK